jgi:hypothetical protein
MLRGVRAHVDAPSYSTLTNVHENWQLYIFYYLSIYKKKKKSKKEKKRRADIQNNRSKVPILEEIRLLNGN